MTVRGTPRASTTARPCDSLPVRTGGRFFETSRGIAERLGVTFEWDMEVVPGVGHDFRAMSEAAAEYLYGGNF